MEPVTYVSTEDYIKHNNKNDLLTNTIIHNERLLWKDNNLQITFCSDGGVRENIASFGVVASINEKIILRNRQILPAIYNNYTSHRSEAYGVLAAFYSLQKLYQYQKRIIGDNLKINALILCDNKSVVTSINKFQRYGATLKDCYSADYDLLGEIGKIWKQLRKQQLFIKVNHIKGHQDRVKQQLNHQEKLNVEADKLATEALSLKKITVPTKLFANASLCINNLLVTASNKKELRRAHQSMDLREYMIESNKWENNVPEMIWWDVHEKSMYSTTYDKRRVIQKFIHNKLPCNYRQNKYNDYKPSLCGACKTTIETQDHIFQCTECPARKILRNKYCLELNTIME
jgi:predicted RNA-binding Zn-ribbon protein involved in translation (DUF1610 family)